MMGHYITRGEIILMLKQWQAAQIDTQQLWDWASHRFQAGQADYDDWEEQNSVAQEMLSALDSLDLHLMQVDDVAIHLAFLATPLGAFQEASKQWRAALQTIDYDERRQRLRDDPIYALYCY